MSPHPTSPTPPSPAFHESSLPAPSSSDTAPAPPPTPTPGLGDNQTFGSQEPPQPPLQKLGNATAEGKALARVSLDNETEFFPVPVIVVEDSLHLLQRVTMKRTLIYRKMVTEVIEKMSPFQEHRNLPLRVCVIVDITPVRYR